MGKRCGSKTMRQEEINFLLVTHAAAGLQVVRLKSGDPLIFGRAGEEIEALRRSSIEYEIVPGVTSALGAAAAAGIPLTHRRSSSTLVLTAGHRASENDRGLEQSCGSRIDAGRLHAGLRSMPRFPAGSRPPVSRKKRLAQLFRGQRLLTSGYTSPRFRIFIARRDSRLQHCWSSARS